MLTKEHNGQVGMENPASENLPRQNLPVSCRWARRNGSVWETGTLIGFYPSTASGLDFALPSQPEYSFQRTGKGLRLHTEIYIVDKKQKVVAVLHGTCLQIIGGWTKKQPLPWHFWKVEIHTAALQPLCSHCPVSELEPVTCTPGFHQTLCSTTAASPETDVCLEVEGHPQKEIISHGVFLSQRVKKDQSEFGKQELLKLNTTCRAPLLESHGNCSTMSHLVNIWAVRVHEQ